MFTTKSFVYLSLSTLTVLTVQSEAQASLKALASDAYYTFGPNVSANSDLRLLVDKAADIGFPDLQSISFLKFDSFPTLPEGENFRAILKLQQETDLLEIGEPLIPATDDRPLSVSVYNLLAPFDDVNGNIADIDYGVDGANAIATTLVGDNGVYNWDITSLVNQWIEDPSSNNGLALSGLFGNVNDGRNAYAGLITVGTQEGRAPTIRFAPIPEPTSAIGLFSFALLGLGSAFKRKSLKD